MDLPAHRPAAYPAVKGRINFKELGYSDDPARAGWRFYITLGRGVAPK
jgi:hypothetical protein